MKFVVQRVKETSLTADGKPYSKISHGLVCFVGFTEGDENVNMDWFVNKIAGLRVFEDENQKMNLNLTQVNGEIMIVPNFTLYADCSHGFRPSFINALHPSKSSPMFDQIVEKFKAVLGDRVKTGVFGADMQIDQHNDGPITIVIDSNQI